MGISGILGISEKEYVGGLMWAFFLIVSFLLMAISLGLTYRGDLISAVVFTGLAIYCLLFSLTFFVVIIMPIKIKGKG